MVDRLSSEAETKIPFQRQLWTRDLYFRLLYYDVVSAFKMPPNSKFAYNIFNANTLFNDVRANIGE